MSTDKKLLTVFGATGNQGGSVISAVLGNPSLSAKYALRAITRDTSKPAAQKLASQGVDLAVADLNDKSSIATAIKGSYGVFAVTNYWESQSKTVEYNQGVTIVDACVAEGVKHLVWSALPHVSKLTDGIFTKVEHFDSKAEVAEYAEENKGEMLVSNFMPGFFMSNLLTQIKKQESGEVGLALPWDPQTTWVPLLDIRKDTGKFVIGLFEASAAANGAYVQGVSQWVHPREITDMVSSVTGKEVKFIQTPMTVEAASKMPKIPEELMQNMMLVRDYSYFGKGAQAKQGESDGFFLKGDEKVKWEVFAKENTGTWQV